MNEEELKTMDKNELLGVIKAQRFEIERLNKELDKTRLSELDKEYKLNQVREYIKEHNLFSFSENDHDWYAYITDNNTKNELLEILDKVD